MKKITEFFTALWITVRDDMKKEAQTYKEEREQQKRQERKRRQENGQSATNIYCRPQGRNSPFKNKTTQ